MVRVDVEYCGVCNFSSQCKLLKDFIEKCHPNAVVVCQQGRRGSFEVKIDDNLVHSKLQSLAFPNHESLSENVKRAEQGLPLSKVQEDPIENCNVM